MTDLYENKDDIIVLTADNFEEKVMKSKDIWIVEFYATWCPACKAAAPHYDEAAARLKGRVKLGKVDIDAQKTLASRFEVT